MIGAAAPVTDVALAAIGLTAPPPSSERDRHTSAGGRIRRSGRDYRGPPAVRRGPRARRSPQPLRPRQTAATTRPPDNRRRCSRPRSFALRLDLRQRRLVRRGDVVGGPADEAPRSGRAAMTTSRASANDAPSVTRPEVRFPPKCVLSTMWSSSDATARVRWPLSTGGCRSERAAGRRDGASVDRMGSSGAGSRLRGVAISRGLWRSRLRVCVSGSARLC